MVGRGVPSGNGMRTTRTRFGQTKKKTQPRQPQVITEVDSSTSQQNNNFPNNTPLEVQAVTFRLVSLNVVNQSSLSLVEEEE